MENIIEYKESLKIIRNCNKLYSKDNELIKSIIVLIDYIILDSENESKEDIIEYGEIIKSDLFTKHEEECTHCDYPHI